jgi:hypothetical protein
MTLCNTLSFQRIEPTGVPENSISALFGLSIMKPFLFQDGAIITKELYISLKMRDTQSII